MAKKRHCKTCKKRTRNPSGICSACARAQELRRQQRAQELKRQQLGESEQKRDFVAIVETFIHSKTFARILVGFCFLSFLCGGLYLVYYGWTNLRDARASIDWPTTEGNIVASQPAQGSGDNFRAGYIKYVYTVNGVAYSSDAVGHGRGYLSEHFQRYPVGKSVTVTYDPKDVTNAVLEPGEFHLQTALIVGGGVLFLCSCVIVIVGYELVRTVYRAFRKKTE